MTLHVILWCGYVKPPVQRSPEADFSDAAASINDLETAFQAAQALGASPADIHGCVCDPDLLPRSFETDCRPATGDALRLLAREIAGRATPGDVLLFVATNHGESTDDPEARLGGDGGLGAERDEPRPKIRGLSAQAFVDEFDDEVASPAPLLTPALLAECLEPIRGGQVVVAAACHAGCFLDIGEPGRRLVLTSCGADEKYWFSHLFHPGECSCSPFIVELFAAWCGVALWDDLPLAKLPLAAAFDRAKERLAAAGARTVPLRAGSVEWPAR